MRIFLCLSAEGGGVEEFAECGLWPVVCGYRQISWRPATEKKLRRFPTGDEKARKNPRGLASDTRTALFGTREHSCYASSQVPFVRRDSPPRAQV